MPHTHLTYNPMNAALARNVCMYVCMYVCMRRGWVGKWADVITTYTD